MIELAKALDRLGTESAFSVLAEAKKLEAQGKPMIHLGLGQPDFKTPKHVVEAAKKALDDGHHGYVLSNGIPECREAVARWVKRLYNADIDPNRVLIMPGGKPTMYYAITCYGEPGVEIIHPTPAFPIYESMINYSGAKAVPYDLTEDKDLKFDPDKILSLITDKTRLLILINPNNPTGSFVEKPAIDYLAKELEKHPQVTILSDEIYSRQIFDYKEMPSLLEYESIKDRLIVLEGWSKTYCMTGWRLGWSIWPKYLIEHANKICVNYNSCATSISQYAGLEAIKGSQKEITKIVSEFQKRKEYVFNELNKLEKISCFEPGGAFYAFPNISKTGLSGNKFSEIALEEKGVALVPGSSFGDNAGEFVRISFANSLENIKEAIKRLSTI